MIDLDGITEGVCVTAVATIAAVVIVWAAASLLAILSCAHIPETRQAACQETCHHGGAEWHRWTPKDGCHCMADDGQHWEVRGYDVRSSTWD